MIEYFSQQHSLDFTPAGQWELDPTTNKKIAINAKRYDNLDWANYPNDNMGRIIMPHHIVVLDIDSAETHIHTDDTMIDIPALNLTNLPIGLYTQTSREGSYHIYYQTNSDDVRTVIKLNGLDIDILRDRVVFEWHSFSPYNELHKGEILPLPKELHQMIKSQKSNHAQQPARLNVVTNYVRASYVKAYLKDELTTTSETNKLFRSILPKTIAQNEDGKYLRKYSWDKIDFNYTMMNGIAVKLTTTAELDFNKHTLPMLHKVMLQYGIDPNSQKSIDILQNQILASLPQHKEIALYNQGDNVDSIEELVSDQSAAALALFRVIDMGQVKFFHIDKHSFEAVPHNGSFMLSKDAAKAMHPERAYFSDKGQLLLDDNVPIIETVEDPWRPLYHWDHVYNRHCINFSFPTQFKKEADPQPEPHDSRMLRLVYSVVHPDYRELVLAWMAQVVFGNTPPRTVLWCSTRGSVKGGTGKSMLTVTILSAILQQQANTIDDETMASGFDVTGDVRLLSLEEGKSSGAAHQNTYNTVKRLTGGSYSKSNKKYGAMTSRVMKVAVSGSSNTLPKLDQSDRRYICLEPAHLDKETEPLDRDDIKFFNSLENHLQNLQDEHIAETQMFADYLYYLYLNEWSDEIDAALFQEAPETKYRKEWVIGGLGNVKTITHNLMSPRDLIDTVYEDRIAADELTSLLEYLISMYHPNTGKISLSWKWFAGIIPLIASDDGIGLTKHSIEKMLGEVKFMPGSEWAIKKSKELEPEWAQAFYTFKASQEVVDEYIAILKEMRS